MFGNDIRASIQNLLDRIQFTVVCCQDRWSQQRARSGRELIGMFVIGFCRLSSEGVLTSHQG
jgi:hypothetical protein